MKEEIETLTPMAHVPGNRCFGCGPANATGLHLEFLLAEDNSVVCLVTVPDASKATQATCTAASSPRCSTKS